MTRSIWLVVCVRGAWSDTTWEPIAAFLSEAKARSYAERFEAHDREGAIRERAEKRWQRELASCWVEQVTLWDP